LNPKLEPLPAASIIIPKNMFSTLKPIEAKNLHGSYPTEFAGSTQNPKKIIGTSNQPIRTKIFPKKSMFSILKV
jgi:hypothetical protein